MSTAPDQPGEQAQLEVEVRGDRAIAHISGELDIANAVAIAEAVRVAVPDVAHAVVVDLGELEFADSTAVRSLFGLVARLSERRLPCAIAVTPASGVARVLELVQFEAAAPVVGSVEEALARLGSGASEDRAR